jgi:hypothetical protein
MGGLEERLAALRGKSRESGSVLFCRRFECPQEIRRRLGAGHAGDE